MPRKLTTKAITDDAITSDKIVADAITSDKIVAGAVTADIPSQGITTDKIADLGVTHAKLHTTMDLSSKTITLPSTSVTHANLHTDMDLSSKSVTLPDATLVNGRLVVNGASGSTYNSNILSRTTHTQTAGSAFSGYDNIGSSNSALVLQNNPSSETSLNYVNLQFNVWGGTQNRVGGIGLHAVDASHRHADLVFYTDEGGGRTEALRIKGQNKTLLNPGGGLMSHSNINQRAGFWGDSQLLQGGPIFKSDRYYHGNATGNFDWIDFYTSGHWGQTAFGHLWIVTDYYGGGVRYYHWTANRGGYLSLTQQYSSGGEQRANASVVGSTATGGSHSGQSVYRSTLRINSGGTYEGYYAIIQICMGQQMYQVCDNSTTQSAATNWANSNGGQMHFRTHSIAGYPYRKVR